MSKSAYGRSFVQYNQYHRLWYQLYKYTIEYPKLSTTVSLLVYTTYMQPVTLLSFCTVYNYCWLCPSTVNPWCWTRRTVTPSLYCLYSLFICLSQGIIYCPYLIVTCHMAPSPPPVEGRNNQALMSTSRVVPPPRSKLPTHPSFISIHYYGGTWNTRSPRDVASSCSV